MIRVWKFVVTVLDEDYDNARDRLQTRLDDDADYEVETWPGEDQAERIAALEAVIAEARRVNLAMRHPGRTNIDDILSASPSDALKRAKREAATEGRREGFEEAVKRSRYSYENPDWWVNPYDEPSAAAIRAEGGEK